jgi:cell division protein ZapA
VTVPRAVHIEVQGQTYSIRTTLDEAYVQDLAKVVDQRMRKISESSPTSDVVSLAVLAALNLADELRRTREDRSSVAGSLVERAEELERIVDQALALAE